jgi:two-component system, OmpR family, response regulator
VKLLLIEDDVALAEAIRRGLVAEGFTVEVAVDGVDGLWLATEGSHDVIVLDLMLPGRDGFGVCAELRAAGRWTPVLVLTARTADRDQVTALETGADDYLTKPFAFAVLLARVRALTRRVGGGVPVPAQVGDLRVDSPRQLVWRGDHEVRLTAREFAVLEFLVRRAGQVLPKAGILAGVWDQDFDGDPNIVEVYIRRLRRKLDEPYQRRTIQTVRGAGYRLADDAGPDGS